MLRQITQLRFRTQKYLHLVVTLGGRYKNGVVKKCKGKG